MFAALPRATVEPVIAADAKTVAGTAIADSSADDKEANRSFLKAYAKASERLKAGLTRVHARARLRITYATQKEPAEWTALEFFAKDGKRRVNIDHGQWHNPSDETQPMPPEAMLWTPDVAAHVIDPGTELAWGRYLSDKPDPMFEQRFGGNAWSYLDVSYSMLDCLSEGWGVLDRVDRDPENEGWLRVSCRLISDKPGKTMGKQYGTMEVWLDDAHDFVTRKVRRLVGSAEMLGEAGPYVRTVDGGWLPKQYSLRFYDRKVLQGGAAGEPDPVGQRTEFELLAVEPLDFPDSYFTLDALGVSFPRRSSRLWLLFVLGAVLLTAVVIGRAKTRVRRAASPNPSGSQHGSGDSL